jgi:hypothetical protein
VPLRFVPLRLRFRRIDLCIIVLLFYSLAFLLYFIKFHICQKIDSIQSLSHNAHSCNAEPTESAEEEDEEEE